MGTLIVAAVLVLITSVLAFRANARFHGEDRLPMQWGITGEANWSAPRRLGLAVMPTLAAIVLGFFAFLSLHVSPRPGQEGLMFPLLLGMGATLIGVQLLHFWLIAKTLRRNAG